LNKNYYNKLIKHNGKNKDDSDYLSGNSQNSFGSYNEKKFNTLYNEYKFLKKKDKIIKKN